MNQNLNFRTMQKGFTLVELLIVVIILSILAAIALPQFSASTTDARLAALDSNLGNIRSVIDLYAQQHNGVYPGVNIATGGTCDAGAAATAGAANTQAAFMAQMTMYTNAAGEACTGSGANYRFGPYLKKGVLPANPITNNNALEFQNLGLLGLNGTSAGLLGWKYDAGTGQFIANDTNFIDGTALPAFDDL